MDRLLVTALAALLLAGTAVAGCGGAAQQRARPPAMTGPLAPPGDVPPEPTADFDLDDPAYSLLGESEAADRALTRRSGRRADYRVPAALLRGLHDGPLAHAAIVRAWTEIAPGDAAYRRLNAGQRAVYALTWADDEILDGGFWQFLYNETGALAGDLVAAAHRVGAAEHERVFRDLLAVFPDGVPPAEAPRRAAADAAEDDPRVAAADDRYALLQYRRRTSLAIILGAYVDAHRDEFAVGG